MNAVKVDIMNKKLKIICACVPLLLVVGFVVCFIIFSSIFVSPQEEVINSIGEYECDCYYSNNIVQDHTDFAVYSFKNPDIENAESFQKVTDTTEIDAYLDDFEKWVRLQESSEVNKHYDFDRSIIDNEDYFYIADKSFEDNYYKQFVSYDLYIFDIQTEKLYFFHNNI